MPTTTRDLPEVRYGAMGTRQLIAHLGGTWEKLPPLRCYPGGGARPFWCHRYRVDLPQLDSPREVDASIFRTLSGCRTRAELIHEVGNCAVMAGGRA